MAILIKGMEMPTRCEDCFCYRHNAEYDYAYCNISSTNVLGHGNARLNSCPLIELPPHGDLIDRDALNIDISKSVIFTVAKNRPSAEMRGAFKVLDRLENAPTIIEAEEADNEQE